MAGKLERLHLDEVMRRDLEVAQPEQIFLSRSDSRECVRSSTDLDLVGAGVYAAAASREDLERYRDGPEIVTWQASSEERTDYETA